MYIYALASQIIPLIPRIFLFAKLRPHLQNPLVKETLNTRELLLPIHFAFFGKHLSAIWFSQLPSRCRIRHCIDWRFSVNIFAMNASEQDSLGSKKMVDYLDYRELNTKSLKNRYPLPLIDDILHRLAGAKIFTALDLKNAYHRIRTREGDEQLGAFEYQVGWPMYRLHFSHTSIRP